MFERMAERVGRAAERRARARAAGLTEAMRAELPGGIRVEEAPDGVTLSGRGLRRRFLLDPALRWLAASLR